MEDPDDLPRSTARPGPSLEAMSVSEISDYITWLEEEKVRAERTLVERREKMASAAALFKGL